MKLFNKIKYVRRKLKSKNWINNKIVYLIKVSEELNNYYTFECSDYFRGSIYASRSRVWYYKRYKQVDRQIKFLEKTLKQIK